MKKKSFGMLALFVAAALFLCFKNKPAKPRQLTTVNATLNGVDALTATTMIQNFEDNYAADGGAKSISAWYRADQLKAINDLLTSEASTIGTDGLRFYFASDKPVSPNTKLHVKIFLVPTIPKVPTNGHTSTHGDYYAHTGVFSNGFLTTETGIAMDDQADVGASNGASLYSKTQPANGVCNMQPTPHYLPANKAYSLVQARNEKNTNNPTTAMDTSPYNTISDWYRLCFITSLFNAITDPNNHLDGLRIYLGKGQMINGDIRDVVVLVPTHNVNGSPGVDDYDCMEDLAPVSKPFCNDRSDSANYLQSTRKRLKSLIEIARSTNGGGYDNGELCPFNCN